MTLGKRLAAILLEEGITQKELSELTGIPSGSMSAYVNDKSTPTSSVLAKIISIDALSKYTLWLLTGTDDSEGKTNSPRERIQAKCGLLPEASTTKASGDI